MFLYRQDKKRERRKVWKGEREKRAKGDKEGTIKVFIQCNEIDSSILAYLNLEELY